MPDKMAPTDFWGSVSSYECGFIGGKLAKLITEAVEEALTEEAVSAVLSSFRQAVGQPSSESGDILPH